jgi:hypothetical protein
MPRSYNSLLLFLAEVVWQHTSGYAALGLLGMQQLLFFADPITSLAGLIVPNSVASNETSNLIGNFPKTDSASTSFHLSSFNL